jgi:hypothetical protein
MKTVSSAYVNGTPPIDVCGERQLCVPGGLLPVIGLGGVSTAWSPRPATAPLMIRRAECLSQDLAGGGTGHDNHGTEGNILKNHRQAFVATIFGHHLGLWPKVLKMKGRRHGHSPIVSLVKSSRNRRGIAGPIAQESVSMPITGEVRGLCEWGSQRE